MINGNMKISEWTLFETPYQNIRSVHIQPDEIVFSGEVWGMVTRAEYRLRFFAAEDIHGEPVQSHLGFAVDLEVQQGSVNRLFLNYWCDPRERFYGFGVQVMG